MASEALVVRPGFIDWTCDAAYGYALGNFTDLSVEQRYWLFVKVDLLFRWLTDSPQEVRMMADTHVPAGAAEVKIVHTGKKKPKKKRY